MFQLVNEIARYAPHDRMSYRGYNHRSFIFQGKREGVDCLQGHYKHFRYARLCVGGAVAVMVGILGYYAYDVTVGGYAAPDCGYPRQHFVDVIAVVVVPYHKLVAVDVDIVLVEAAIVFAQGFVVVVVEIQYAADAKTFQTFHDAKCRVGAVVQCVAHMNQIHASL